MTISKNLSKVRVIQREQGWSGLWRAGRKKLSQKLYDQEYWGQYGQEAKIFATLLDFSENDIKISKRVNEENRSQLNIQSITWLLPEFQHPFYGGIYTILRFADYLKRNRHVDNRFLILGSMDEKLAAQKIGESFPALRNVSIHSFNVYDQIKNIAPSDAIISTLWATAYFALRINNVKRKFYFIQDYEPLFYPAGTISAQTEATYSFRFYGIANTPPIKEIYESRFGGKAEFFIPCVDTDLFYPRESLKLPEQPYKVFFYGRPQHPRNGFELGANSLKILKKRMGDSIQIISAGDTWHPRDHDLLGVVENLGRLAYQDTCELYRQCRAGVTMMFTNHPSYLPLELMASGCLVITNANPATSRLLKMDTTAD